MSTIIGYSPEITAMLESLRTRIGVMLDYPSPMVEMSQKEIHDYDRRFDIIIGNVGLKDLSRVKEDTKSLPGLDQWPNTAPSSPATPSESPERVETAEEAWKAFWKEWIGPTGNPDWFSPEMKAAFRAGYEAGRKAK